MVDVYEWRLAKAGVCFKANEEELMKERRFSKGVEGLVKIFMGAFILGLIIAALVNEPKGIALQFASVMSMLYCVVYVATKAAYRDLKSKERRSDDGSNEIIDGR